MNLFKLVNITLVSILVAGCGEGQVSNQTAPDTIFPPNAHDGFDTLSISEGESTVSLRDLVVDPQGLPVTLESVKPVNAVGCGQVTTIDTEALTFTVDTDDLEFCTYTYTVKNHPSQGTLAKETSAKSVVLNRDGDNILPSASISATVDSKVKVENRPDIIEFTLLGPGELEKDARGVLWYTASSDPGYATVLYTFAGGSIKPTYITISSNPSEGIDLSSKTYYYTYDIARNRVPYVSDKEYIFNLKDVVPMGLDLIEVYSSNAKVKVEAPAKDLKFSFNTKYLGVNTITYVVTDHNGAYATQNIEVIVHDKEGVQHTFDPVYLDPSKDSSRLMPPVNRFTVESSRVVGSPTGFHSGFHFLPEYRLFMTSFTSDQAHVYCESKDEYLPTVEQLSKYNTNNSWPDDLDYWATDTSGVDVLVDLKTHSAHIPFLNEPGYLSCFNQGDIYIVDSYTNSGVGSPAYYRLNSASKEAIYAFIDSGDVEIQSADEGSGNWLFTITSSTIGTYDIEFSNNEETITLPVTFFDPPKSAETVYVGNFRTVNDSHGDIFKYKVLDKSGAPMVGFSPTINNIGAGFAYNVRPSDENGITEITFNYVNSAPSDIVSSDVGLVFGLFATEITVNFVPDETYFASGDPVECSPVVTRNCIETISHGAAIYTQPVEETYLQSLGFYKNKDSPDNGFKTYASSSSDYATFNQTGDNVEFGTQDGQAERFCDYLNIRNFKGINDWRLTTEPELQAISQSSQPSGWPTSWYYWSSTVNGSNYKMVYLDNGNTYNVNPSSDVYASCVSNP